MTETTNTQRMLEAYKRAQADIASLTDWFECELEKLDDDSEPTWAAVGTLAEVRERLIETLAFFSGVEQDEIQR
ncbi:MAG: hypothetical protein R6V11_07700, partial [Ectothiorhodospiraceae bacterium]